MHSNFRGQILLVLFAGSLAALALTNPTLWWLALLGLMIFLYTSVMPATRNGAFVLGFIFGFISGGASIWWAFDAIPMAWFGFSGAEGLPMIALIWLILSITFAIPVALYSSIIWELRGSLFVPLLAAILWPIVEWSKMWGFSIIAVGPESLVGAHFSPAVLATVLAENNTLLLLAKNGGLFALALYCGFVGALPLILRFQREVATSLALIFLPFVLVPFLTQNSAVPKQAIPRVAVVTSFVQAAKSTADIIAFPEGETLEIRTPEDIAAWVTKTFKTREVLVAVPVRSGDTKDRVGIAFFTPTEGLVALQEKLFLMPEGEYTPLLSRVIFWWANDGTVGHYFNSLRPVTRGEVGAPVVFHGARVTGLLCSDILSPELVAAQTKAGAQIIINSGNQEWFNGSHILLEREQQIGKIYAVQHNLYILAANKGLPSYLINPNGEVEDLGY